MLVRFWLWIDLVCHASELVCFRYIVLCMGTKISVMHPNKKTHWHATWWQYLHCKSHALRSWSRLELSCRQKSHVPRPHQWGHQAGTSSSPTPGLGHRCPTTACLLHASVCAPPPAQGRGRGGKAWFSRLPSRLGPGLVMVYLQWSGHNHEFVEQALNRQ